MLGPYILKPPVKSEKYGLTLKVVLKGKDVYIENMRVVLLMTSLKMERIVKSQVYRMLEWEHSNLYVDFAIKILDVLHFLISLKN